MPSLPIYYIELISHLVQNFQPHSVVYAFWTYRPHYSIPVLISTHTISALYGIHPPSTAKNSSPMENNQFRTHTRLLWHICAFYYANSPSTSHKLTFHDKHPPNMTKHICLRWQQICTVNNCLLRHIPHDAAHIRLLGHKYAFHGTYSPSIAHSRLLQYILAFYGNICLSWHTSLKRHKKNKSVTALIIAKHDSIVAYTTPDNGKK